MKAITVRQPWASLIAAGVKTIETRPRRTSYRGRIAIHAAIDLRDFWRIWHEGHQRSYCPEARVVDALHDLDIDSAIDPPVPVGAVVASAVLTDCVPVPGVMADGDVSETLWADDRDLGPGESFYFTGLIWWLHERERPLGDYSDCRWALLLDDIAPTTERCPACWGDGEDLAVYDQPCRVCAADALDELGPGRCDPVPAHGQQAVPWEWTP